MEQTEKKELNERLIKAAMHGKVEDVELLLDRGADINHKDQFGSTALLDAAIHGDAKIVELLLNRGADVHHRSTFWGDTALFKAAIFGFPEIVELLLDRGADIHHQDNFGNTALIDATRSGKVEIVKLLLDRGADIHHQSASGETAFSIAAECGYSNIVKLLEDYTTNLEGSPDDKNNYPETEEDISDDQAEFSFDKILDKITEIQTVKANVIKKGNDLGWSRKYDSREIQKMHLKELVKARLEAQDVCGPAEKCDKKIEENMVVLKEILNPHKPDIESLCENSKYSYSAAQSKFCDHIPELECSGDAKVTDICDLYLG